MGEMQLTKLRAQNFGYIFQGFNLIPTLTAQENVETALVPLGVSADERRERAARALTEVGLGERLGHLQTELSGGQQQRVAIARALVKEPKVILADEPTGNLDEDTRDDIFGLLERLWGDRVIMVTHDSALSKRVPRLAQIKHGKLTIKRERADAA
jgi:putative ABC transport system ATP-binding protein